MSTQRLYPGTGLRQYGDMTFRAVVPYLTLLLACALAASAVGDFVNGPRWGWVVLNSLGAVCGVLGFILQIRQNRRAARAASQAADR